MTACPPQLEQRPSAPASIQARRIFLLSRLLTAVTGIICFMAHVIVGAIVWVTPAQDSDEWMDAWVTDVRVWVVIFTFWTAVMLTARKHLRLHR